MADSESRTTGEDARRAGLRAWIEHWKRVGPKLERIKRDELRRYKHEENIEIIDALLQFGLDHASPRGTSGLVELQRVLHRKKRR
ncbi:MAG: hypothetical protein GXP27_18260 [Planctomycetes bacterium]|nr:hypothetical protein [Planctomycetota bacterium]